MTDIKHKYLKYVSILGFPDGSYYFNFKTYILLKPNNIV